MKQIMKPILVLAIILLVLPLSFAANLEKHFPAQIDEPGIIEVTITIQTEDYRSMDLVEMFPVGTEIINWNANAPAELEIEVGEFNHFGDVVVYRWDFEEINQDTVTLTYEIELEEYGKFQTTTILVYEGGFFSRKYTTHVGEVELISIIRTELQKPLWQLVVLLIATGILISGIYYRYYKKYGKAEKPKARKRSRK